jgi:hypothetical protein
MPGVYWNRRCFIGGSDARIIMGSDEAALIRLWREKRGEAEPEDLSGKSFPRPFTAIQLFSIRRAFPSLLFPLPSPPFALNNHVEHGLEGG